MLVQNKKRRINMPEKKPNVLTQIIYAFRQKKPPHNDIVARADKVIEDYILSKNKLIHRKCRQKDRSGVIIALSSAAALLSIYLIFTVIR
jgi:hypothetical protein